MVRTIKKPVTVWVFGILNLVFAGVGLAFSSMVIFQLVRAWQSPGAVMGYKLFLLIMNGIGFGFSIWLGALGGGLLRMKSWARRGSIVYSLLGILFFVVETGVNLLALSIGWVTISNNAIAGFLAGMALGSIGGLIYPVLLLKSMNSPSVKAAFQGTTTTP